MLRNTWENRASAPGRLVPDAVESRCRALFVQMQSTLPLDQVLILGVTSPARAVGRSTVALGLALAGATLLGSASRVLLIDADLENPTLHQRFGVANAPGLTEVLADEVPLDRAAVPIAAGVWLLPAGRQPRNVLRQLKEFEERHFFESLAAAFDALIVDLPPVHSPGLGTLPPRLVPRICMVTLAGVTSGPDLQEAVAALPPDHLAAVLLNGQRQRMPRWLDLVLP
ncbi:MAG TPA: hypothetical protein VM536_13380 [Chloroflexia bacterium]|nr:hypothetical protein [Chloroflexia bacterium]